VAKRKGERVSNSADRSRTQLTPLEQQTRRFMQSVQRAENAAASTKGRAGETTVDSILAQGLADACQALRDMSALIAPMLDQLGVVTRENKALTVRVAALEKGFADVGTVVTDLRMEHQRYGPVKIEQTATEWTQEDIAAIMREHRPDPTSS
jgi:hypothetical protein